MDKGQIEIILKGNLENEPLTNNEKEIALKVLSDLEGTLVIRATSILEFCLKAVQYSKVQMAPKTINQMRKEHGLEPIEGGETILTQLP